MERKREEGEWRESARREGGRIGSTFEEEREEQRRQEEMLNASSSRARVEEKARARLEQ